MKVLERKDSCFLEIMRALLQLMRMMHEEEIYEMLAVKLRNFLNDFMAKAIFLSYLKRKSSSPVLAYSSSEKIVEIICGMNHSEGNCKMKDINWEKINAYGKIEKFRDHCKWNKIIFVDLKEPGKVDFYFGPSIIILIIGDNVSVIENTNDENEIIPFGFGFFHHFFRLYKEKDKLIIHYAHECMVDMQTGCFVANRTLADFKR